MLVLGLQRLDRLPLSLAYRSQESTRGGRNVGLTFILYVGTLVVLPILGRTYLGQVPVISPPKHPTESYLHL